MVHLPILLIHGFNGAPSNWTGPADQFPQFLAAHDYDPDLIRVFDYGYSSSGGKKYYDNTGDIRQIAHRLDEANSNDAIVRACAVDRLSQESVARGGPQKVTIIAHSSGGLVARYYMTRASEDRFGTRYRGNVGRVIFLGTPHLGVDVEDILDPLPSTLTYGLMIRFHYMFPLNYHGDDRAMRKPLRRLHKGAWRNWRKAEEGAEEMPAFRQLHPGSEFLEDLNRPGAMPQDVDYVNIVGDVCADVRLQTGHRTFHKEKDFGDFLVTVDSAGRIPNAASKCFPIRAEYGVSVEMRRGARQVVQFERPAGPVPIHRHMRSLPAVRKQIMELLASH